MRFGLTCCLITLSLLGLCTAQESDASIRQDTNIAAEPLDQALRTLAKERQFQVLYRAELVHGVRTAGAVGEYTPEEALKQLLSGTGLSYKYLDANTVTVFATAAQSAIGAGAGQDQTNATLDNSKEAGKKSSQDFRVTQVDQAPVGTEVSEEKKQEKKAALEEVVVTGSRIPTGARESAQEVKVYTKEQIAESGQTSVADFLNTLPDVSVSVNEQNQFFIASSGVTSVQLHGLPIGTTLVLINGRRVETSGVTQGGTGNFFDLSNIPLAAVERIEVVSEGSSAIYGSDAIAGVVNIILKKDLDGLEVNAKYGAASDIAEWDENLAFGKRWDDASFSVIGSAQSRGELVGDERGLTANNDYTAYGGPDSRIAQCNPGNVFSANGNPLPGLGAATFAAVPAEFNGIPSRQEFLPTAGTLNLCSGEASVSLIPPVKREGLLANGNVSLSTVEVFTEILFSHQDATTFNSYPGLFAQPGFAEFTASATNPFNPFGVPVGVGLSLTELGRAYQENDETFFRPLVGVRGTLGSAWSWEVTAWESRDRSRVTLGNETDFTAIQNALDSTNPATALNPFVAGAPASNAVLQPLVSNLLSSAVGQTDAINAFARGSLLTLPTGTVQAVIGSEFDHDALSQNLVNFPGLPPNDETNFHRERYALFAEARVPIIGPRSDPQVGDILALNLAGRYDHYNDFGGKSTPQFGAELRPASSLLIRATYGQAFRAPPLSDLDAASFSVPGSAVTDPLNGNKTELVTVVEGANPLLRPETGESHTIGIVYSLQDLRVTVTQWVVDETNSIQFLSAQTIVDNEDLFPGHVIRAPTTNGQPGPITEVLATSENFGQLDVQGIDYAVTYKLHTAIGTFTPSAAATQTYRYSAALTPQSPPIDKVSVASDDLNWSPRWKGTAAIGWQRGPYAAKFDGRYIGKYQDYDSTAIIGNFWLCDANFRYALGKVLRPDSPWLSGLYLELGGVNIFNRLPQFSNFGGGGVGFDPLQADIRGRFIYAQIGMKL